jgi:NADPH2:quinone reductase
MKAIRVHEFGDPSVMKYEDVSDPLPGPGQVVVRVAAAGVNPVETYIRSGKYAILPELPYTPGKDAAGTVEVVGEGVDDLTIGDRVFTAGTITGSYAQYALCDRTTVFKLPDRIGFSEGAGVGVPCGAAWRALFVRGRAEPAETVLVHGATGAVGLAAIQLARAAGLTVIGTGGSDQGRLAAMEHGAHFVAGHTDVDRIREYAGSHGIDLILEMLADQNLDMDLSLLSRRGRVVVIGSRGRVEIDPRSTMGPELSILGMSINTITPDEHHAMYTALASALESGVLKPLISLELPLVEASVAHDLVMRDKAPGKIVLVP